jgi:putative membrane protein
MCSGDDSSGWVVLVSASVALLPMLSVVLLVPILFGVAGGAGQVSATLEDALVVGWLVVILVVFVLGASVAARLIRDGRTDDARRELRLALARGDITPEEFEERSDLLESEA